MCIIILLKVNLFWNCTASQSIARLIQFDRQTTFEYMPGMNWFHIKSRKDTVVHSWFRLLCVYVEAMCFAGGVRELDWVFQVFI